MVFCLDPVSPLLPASDSLLLEGHQAQIFSPAGPWLQCSSLPLLLSCPADLTPQSTFVLRLQPCMLSQSCQQKARLLRWRAVGFPLETWKKHGSPRLEVGGILKGLGARRSQVSAFCSMVRICDLEKLYPLGCLGTRKGSADKEAPPEALWLPCFLPPGDLSAPRVPGGADIMAVHPRHGRGPNAQPSPQVASRQARPLSPAAREPALPQDQISASARRGAPPAFSSLPPLALEFFYKLPPSNHPGCGFRAPGALPTPPFRRGPQSGRSGGDEVPRAPGPRSGGGGALQGGPNTRAPPRLARTWGLSPGPPPAVTVAPAP